MGLFSFFRKNKQESASGQGDFLSRSATESAAARGRRTGSRSSAGSANVRGGSRKSAKDEVNDPMLPEKKRARRRLIGAIALVLAMVIVLPMIFDSKPRPLSDDIAIQIPSKDGAKDAGNAAKPADSGLAPKEEVVNPANAAADQSAAGRNAQVASTSPLASAAQALPLNATNAALPDSPESTSDKPDNARALTKTDTKVDTKDVAGNKSNAKSDDRNSVKLSGDNDVAKKDAAKDVDKSKSDDSARAMAILEGKSDKSVKSDKDNTSKKPVANGGKVVIQVAALATQEKIDELRGKLSKAGIPTFIQKVATQDGERTRIRVGPFATHEEANKMRAKINRLGLNATIVAP